MDQNNITLISMEDGTADDQVAGAEIKEMGGGKITGKRGTIHCLTIIGQIEGHMILPPQNKTTKYEHVIPLLTWVEENVEIDGLIVLINTMGGDVEAGLAIAEMMGGMKKPTVSLVLGGGHSIGVPLAVASDFSYIAPSATMTIHPIRMNGTVIGVPQTYEYFAKMQERVVNFVTTHSAISSQKLNELMMNTSQLASDVGTILTADEAVALGLISQKGSISDALETLYSLIEQSKSQV